MLMREISPDRCCALFPFLVLSFSSSETDTGSAGSAGSVTFHEVNGDADPVTQARSVSLVSLNDIQQVMAIFIYFHVYM